MKLLNLFYLSNFLDAVIMYNSWYIYDGGLNVVYLSLVFVMF